MSDKLWGFLSGFICGLLFSAALIIIAMVIYPPGVHVPKPGSCMCIEETTTGGAHGFGYATVECTDVRTGKRYRTTTDHDRANETLCQGLPTAPTSEKAPTLK